MTGKTELTWSKAEVMKAVDYYLTAEVLKNRHRVVDFQPDSQSLLSGTTYIITLEGQPEAPLRRATLLDSSSHPLLESGS